MSSPVCVYSEIGQLRSVLVHRPGPELNNLTPQWMEHLLFDELPYLKAAQQEHDEFTSILARRGVQIVYIESLLGDILADTSVREELLAQYLQECHIPIAREEELLRSFLASIKDPYDLAWRLFQGTRKSELAALGEYKRQSLSELVADQHPFLALPMPNLYFTRDPFSFVGNGVALSHMWSHVRNRETLFGQYIFNYHPMFKGQEMPIWYDRNEQYSIEGGDILVLSPEVLAIGVSQRTQTKAVENFCKRILQSDSGFKRVLAFAIPKKREFMHLDTVFTMVDKNLFTLHPLIRGPLEVYCMEMDGDHLRVQDESGELDEILRKHLHLSSVKLISCGGNDPLDAAREQWNDGSNTLAIAPREVVVYDRNEVTNNLLREAGVRVHEMRSGELSRGRGGPRCMSMPLVRDFCTF